MHHRAILCVVTFLFLQKYCHSSDPCLNIVTCGKCIQNPECGWCLDKAKRNKCIKLNPNDETQCQSEPITGKGMIYEEVLENENLSSMNPSVQMKPQRISLKIPNKSSYTIKFEFARAWNSLDLYFLMDNSKTMEPHRKMLSTLGNQLEESIKHLTSDFKMGFGTFVEKRIFPFYFHEQSNETCGEGYSYMNHIKLTEAEGFGEKVDSTNSSCNVDTIEGGLDALVQVLVCGEQIGWRHGSTKMVVFSTDAEFHVSGDGKLGGISKPNDGQCHMSGGEYLHDRHMDYPSVSHIGNLMEENKMYVIFAIVCNMNETTCKTYQELPHHTSEKLAKFAYLDLNSTTVMTIITNTYDTILKSVNMTHSFSSEIEVKFRVLCHGHWMDVHYCTDLQRGEKVEFEAILYPNECLEGPQTFKIQPVGILNDYLEIELEVLCNCDCELGGPQEINVEECNFNGNTTCGLCECNEGYSGRKCECVNNSTHAMDDNQCINPDTKLLCSGSGQCLCGICQCENNFKGQYCECQDYNCPKNNGLLCSGLDHGKCDCGECQCNRDWTGDDCSCSTSTELCKTAYVNGMCSNHGNCSCGSCICDDGFYGTHCEGCVVKDNDPNTDCDRCKQFVNCVKIFNNKTVDSSNDSKINCTAIRYVAVTADYLMPTNVEWERCSYSDYLCKTNYRFKKSGDGGLVMEVGPEVCTFIASTTGLLSTIAAILLAAIFMLIIWKFLVTMKDNREFANFLEKKTMEKWHNDNNPIYKDPCHTYQNPRYRPET